MFYFWQGYLTRKTGEGIYKNSLYHHYKFSVHLKLFQNKFGIFLNYHRTWSIMKQRANLRQYTSCFLKYWWDSLVFSPEAKERIPVKWHDKGALSGHQVQDLLQETTCISAHPTYGYQPAFYGPPWSPFHSVALATFQSTLLKFTFSCLGTFNSVVLITVFPAPF